MRLLQDTKIIKSRMIVLTTGLIPSNRSGVFWLRWKDTGIPRNRMVKRKFCILTRYTDANSATCIQVSADSSSAVRAEVFH